MDHELNPGCAGKHDNDITVEVSSADDDGSFTVSKTTKVEELIKMALSQFTLEPGDVYSLALLGKPNEPLAKERTLESYHLRDDAHLVLTSKGGGV